MNDIVAIPIDKVQPFDGQPRHYFEPAALKELAESIREHGQRTPAWVVPLPGGSYELIAGERRWRACQLVGIKTLLCEVRHGLTRDQQYLDSVMENFGRKDCTTMETARSVGRLLEVYSGDKEKVAKAFARSTYWVQQYSYLLRLDPEVAAMLEPPNAALSTQVGVSLANLHPEVQVRLAREIKERGLKHKAAQSLVRTRVAPSDSRVTKGRKRKPSDDAALLTGFLQSLGAGAQAILDLGDGRLKAMFVHRDPSAVAAVKKVLSKRIDQLQRLERML